MRLWVILPLAAPTGVCAQALYASGTHSAREEQIRWFHNRARFSPPSENARLSTSYPVPSGPLHPLAPNIDIMRAAGNHGDDCGYVLKDISHTTPSGSRHGYTAGWLPTDRMLHEGWKSGFEYGGWGTGENVGAGNTAGWTSGAAAHGEWWKSAGHRPNILGDFSEVGVGYIKTGNTYDNYYAVNFGKWTGPEGWQTTAGWQQYHGMMFFTDTLFRDNNPGNNQYDESEGIADMEIRLFAAGVEGTHYAKSTSAGNFAVPTWNFSPGDVAVVRLINKSGSSQTITIPTGFSSSTSVSLANNASADVGAFTIPTGERNFGFRDLGPVPATYAISYSANDATSGTAPDGQTKTHGVALTLRTNAGNLARTGYTYAGWNTAVNGSGTRYAAGGNYTANASATLYACWTARYALVYRAGMGGSIAGQASQTVDHGESGLSVTAQAEPGAVFTAWSDGVSANPRTDLNVTNNMDVTARFASEGGNVPIDWYDDHEITPGDGKNWSDLDQLDPYNKGMTLSEEFIAGTDPSRPDSLFKISRMERDPHPAVSFEPVVSNRLYRLRYCDDLQVNTWIPVSGSEPGETLNGTWLLENEASTPPGRYFRIDVQRP